MVNEVLEQWSSEECHQVHLLKFYLIDAAITHPSRMMVMITMTSKWLNIAMKIIWRKKKVTNVMVKFQHVHNAVLRLLIVKTINAKIMIKT